MGKENSFQQADEGLRHLREGRVLSSPVRQVTGREEQKLEKEVWVSPPQKLCASGGWNPLGGAFLRGNAAVGVLFS